MLNMNPPQPIPTLLPGAQQQQQQFNPAPYQPVNPSMFGSGQNMQNNLLTQALKNPGSMGNSGNIFGNGNLFPSSTFLNAGDNSGPGFGSVP